MSTRFDRAVEVTRDSMSLAVVPAAATILSFSDVARALAADGGGITFPFPDGLPTLWTYVSLPGSGFGAVGGPVSLVTFVPLFLLGLVVTSALEAGFLGALSNRIDDEPGNFFGSVRRFTLRIVGANLIRIGVVLVALPLFVVPPIASVTVLSLSYLVYGLPFAVVANDLGIGDAFRTTLDRALEAGPYMRFGIGHLIIGAVASFSLTSLVRTGGAPGILVGTILVSPPAVFVAVYGLLLFQEFEDDASSA